MADTNQPAKTESAKAPAASGGSRMPMESLRREIDRLFDDFSFGSLRFPFRWPRLATPAAFREADLMAAPAVDLVEHDQAFEVSAELPGMDENSVDVKIAGNALVIKGHKKEEHEEKEKDFYLSERRYGSFERSLPIPDGVDLGRVEATFAKGVLRITLPKVVEAPPATKKIEVKGA